MVIELFIPRLAPNLNDLVRAAKHHRQAYNRIKESWADTIASAVLDHGYVDTFPRCSVHFELVEQNTRRDPDNIASGTAKLVLDGLVKAGVLEGDGWKHIAGLSFSWRVGSPVGVRVVLTETEAA